MALEKKIINDKIEILEDGTIQVREATQILEDGVVISSKFTNRRVLEPGHDCTDEDSDITRVADIFHTNEKVANYKEKQNKIKKNITCNKYKE